MLTRRSFLNTGIACGAFALAGTHARLAFAALPDDRRFIVVILRGALDGLAAVPAHGDPDYAALRGSLALPQSGVDAPIDLDGFFGLHPSLHNLSEMWREKELAIFHNVATPYRERSHFDAQNVLETGGTAPHRLHDGWLNRALGPLALDTGDGALAVSPSPPLLLDGASRVTSWMPGRMAEHDEDLLARVATLYAKDPVLAPALKQALATRATANAAMHDSASGLMTNGGGQGYGPIAPLMDDAGKILAAQHGPRRAWLCSISAVGTRTPTRARATVSLAGACKRSMRGSQHSRRRSARHGRKPPSWRRANSAAPSRSTAPAAPIMARRASLSCSAAPWRAVKSMPNGLD